MTMAHKARIYSFQCGWEALFDSVWEAVPACKGWAQHWTPKFADKAAGIIAASVPFGGSYGEQITLQITENPPGTSWLGVTSTSNFGLYDLGKNNRNIEKLVTVVEKTLASKGINAPASAPQEMPVAPAHSSQPQQVQPASFCLSCGAAITPGTKFCSTCGSPV